MAQRDNAPITHRRDDVPPWPRGQRLDALAVRRVAEDYHLRREAKHRLITDAGVLHPPGHRRHGVVRTHRLQHGVDEGARPGSHDASGVRGINLKENTGATSRPFRLCFDGIPTLAQRRHQRVCCIVRVADVPDPLDVREHTCEVHRVQDHHRNLHHLKVGDDFGREASHREHDVWLRPNDRLKVRLEPADLRHGLGGLRRVAEVGDPDDPVSQPHRKHNLGGAWSG